MVANGTAPATYKTEIDSGSRVQSNDPARSDMSHDSHDLPAERIYKSLWHVALFCIGLYEYRSHKTKLAKGLAVGMMAFHADAAISDALDTKCLSRRILELATGDFDAQHSPYERADRRTSRG